MFAAVDTNFLLALADGDEDALDALKTLRQRASNLKICATPTTLAELQFFKTRCSDARLKHSATIASSSFKKDWGFQIAHLTSTQEAVVVRIAAQLREKGVLPIEERHDAFILVEASLLGAKLFVTEDSVLRNADYPKLVFELGEFDLHPPVIATPKEIVRKFYS